MSCRMSIFRITKLSALLSKTVLVALVVNLSLATLPAISQTYVPPDRGLPGRREGGGTRGGCVKEQPTLTAIVPQTNLGLTTQAQPTLLWYIPTSTAKIAEFELRDAQESVIYTHQIPITGEAGLLKVQLSSAEQISLEPGQRYHWYFSLVCDPQDRSGDIFTEGWIERIQPNPELENQLTQASEIDRATLYAEAGIWHDALATLVNLQQVDRSAVAANWANLLTSVDLASFADKPYLP